MKIAVIGLGYVGLPISLVFAEADVSVLGLDIDPEKIEKLNKGETYIRHVPAERIKGLVERAMFEASTDFARIREVEAVIICVPTPLDKHRQPDISFVLNSARQIGPNLSRGALVVLESTTYPGCTEEELKSVLEETSGLKAGEGFHLAYSPEREDPGNPDSQVKTIPKVVGGYTDKCREHAIELYSKAIDTLVPMSSCKAAEATKLLENIFRSVNIALVNELKVIYDKMGIDIWEVIEAAKTKPFGYMPFYPGPGLGGHCIPIDPFYLTWKAQQYGINTRFIELAGEINTSMPAYVLERISEALDNQIKPLNNSRVLLLGIAYKPNLEDERESPGYALLDLLKARGAQADYFDPFVKVIPRTREHPQWAGKESIAWEEASIRHYDCAVILTAHSSVDYESLAAWASCIVDTRNVQELKASPHYFTA